MKHLEGTKVGMLSVIRRDGRRRGSQAWLCQCDCGNEAHVTTSELTSGRAKSCGCRRGGVTHGHTRGGRGAKSPTMSSWAGMIQRITNPAATAYDHYRKRGITICDRWRYGENGVSAFECFLADMGERPSRAVTLERINNDGNYEPGNCRWATRREQGNNRSTNILIEYQGQKFTFAELARHVGLPKEFLRHRILRAGWPVEAAISEPKQQGSKAHSPAT